MPLPGTIDRQIAYALRIEELQGIVHRLQHRDGSARSGGDRKRCHDRYRAPVLDRPTSARIEQMRIASSVVHEVAFVVARGRHRAVRHVQVRNRYTRFATRVLNRNAPRLAVCVRADDTHIAPEIYQAVLRAEVHCDRGRTVGGVLLAHTAEIDLHFRSQTQRRRMPFDL